MHGIKSGRDGEVDVVLGGAGAVSVDSDDDLAGRASVGTAGVATIERGIEADFQWK